MKFEQLPISEEILNAIKEMGFEEASKIQAQTIKPIIEGKDLIAQSQTGTGKTAAFAIPSLELIDNERSIQILVLAPTRELTIQISKEMKKLAKYKPSIKILPIYGGTDIKRQLKALKDGVQVVIGTPGRIMDHMRRKSLKLDKLKILVLDEADDMFDMGFREDMATILSQTNENKQTCFFSATLGPDIKTFSKLYQKDPLTIKVTRDEVTAKNIKQYYLELSEKMKTEILARLLTIHKPELAIVFCNTKKEVEQLLTKLTQKGFNADGLHGDLKQEQRDIVMKKFRQKTINVLIATDIAARGLDIANLDLVINYDLPQDQEYYVHRIGRTARAGKDGISLTFITDKDRFKFNQIMNYTKVEMEKLELPTIRDLEAANREGLENLILESSLIEDRNSEYSPILNKLLEKGHSLYDISLSLISMLDNNTNKYKHESLDRVDYGTKFQISKSTINKKERGKKSPKMFINKGLRDGLDEKILFKSLIKTCDIPANKIKRINIMRNFSFVDIDKDYLIDSIKKMNGSKIKSLSIKAEYSGK
ncbi:DEAD/DEAH box helicase [Peptoniphilaceae bacterium SGI.131]